jgi:hypothetical protein
MVWSLACGSGRIVTNRAGGLNAVRTWTLANDLIFSPAGVDYVSQSLPAYEPEATTPVIPGAKNPSYPQRVHIQEKAKWQASVKVCEDQIANARRKLGVLGGNSRPNLQRLYAQMLGARDQVADAARRLPGETGDLYEEDHHRLEEAMKALERLEKLWKAEEARS